MGHDIRPMTLEDHAAAHRLWTQAEGLSLGEDDERERIGLYLARNPGLCFVAVAEGRVVGTVLCGHDGRRGILRHLAVEREFRRRGIGGALVKKSLEGLAAQGIKRCNLFVMDHNPEGLRFWERAGWRKLAEDYRTLQTGTGL